MSAIESVLKNLESMDGPGKDIEAARVELEDLRHEAYMSRCRGDVLADLNAALRAENEAMRELLIDVFDLWDDDAIEHSTPDNYTRARDMFDRIRAALPPEKRAALARKETT